MRKILKWFGYIWTILVIATILISIVGMFIAAPTFWEGWKAVMETFSPFNIWNLLLILLFLSPALGAFALRDYLEKRHKG